MSKPQKWAFIFEQLGKDNLEKMLFRAAMTKDEQSRVVIEFDGDRAMDITDHVDEMESNLNNE